MQKLILALVFGSAAAFVPPHVSRAAGATARAAATLDDAPGAGFGVDMGVWDPFNILNGLTPAQTAYFREAEVKHGRVAMLASVGFLVAEKFHPLFGGAISAPSYVAFQATPLQTFWPLVVLAIGAVEVQSGAIGSFKTPEEGMWELKESHEMGDLGFDPLGLKPANADGFKSMQTKELNNGRLAMLAIAGMVAQECATGLQL